MLSASGEPYDRPRQQGVFCRALEVTALDGGVRTLRCRTVAHGHLQQKHHIRDLPVRATVAGSEVLSGHDDEASALEMLLSAFGACLAAGIHANAIARHIEIRSLALDLSADVDRSVHWGTGAGAKPIGFEAVEVVVTIEADAPANALDALVKHATLWSPVANTLYNPVHLKVSLEQGETGKQAS